MTVHIKCVEARNTPFGYGWETAGQVLPVEDHDQARQLLRIPGFSEVAPEQHGRHEAPVTEPEPETDGDETDGDDSDSDSGDGDGAAKKPARGRSKAVTE
ncbi:MAG: hypothetical protein JWO98_4528 [Frankiales bacterium]|nr:hypothetical protein [Frankiales bacterium]